MHNWFKLPAEDVLNLSGSDFFYRPGPVESSNLVWSVTRRATTFKIMNFQCQFLGPRIKNKLTVMILKV